jgi:hydroxymethylpyrimidine pyrophosphatase-like HAD family hydrolase
MTPELQQHKLPARPKMIAIDMDGTLVHTGGYVSEANQAALRTAQQAGARIVIATGRRHSYAMKILRTVSLQPDDIVLSSNGTVARTVGGKLLFRHPMPLETARWLCTQLDEFRDSFVLTFDLLGADGQDMPGALVLEELDALHGSIRSWMEANAPYIRRVRPIEDALTDGEAGMPIQAMLCGGMNRMLQAEALLETTQDDRLSLYRTEYPDRDLCILDILPHGCSKGSGLRQLLQMAELTSDALMSLGDNWNDVPMLELARWPVLMGNAPPALLAKASESGWQVGDSHDTDAVAEAIAAHF